MKFYPKIQILLNTYINRGNIINKSNENKSNSFKKSTESTESKRFNESMKFNGFVDSDEVENSKNPETCEFSIDSGYGDLIGETKYWEIFLAPSQRYLGTCVISLKREVEDLKDLKTEEWDDFGYLVEGMELANKETFNADLLNWSCLKNSVFRKDNPKPHIHWHFIPRYKNPVIFEGLEFDDPDFGFFARAITKKIPENVREKLMELLKENLIL